MLSEQLLLAPFEEVVERSEVRKIDGVPAPICSLVDLVAISEPPAAAATSWT